MTGALALACFVKVCGVVFLGASRSNAAEHAHECGPKMRGAMLVLAGACVAIGLAPFLFWPSVAQAVGAWRPAWAGAETPAPLNTIGHFHMALALLSVAAAWWLWRLAQRHGSARALTWDCGYAAPSARMQYTAGSFARIITEWFAWILRPERHGHRPENLFPVEAGFEEHTPETVLERFVEPAGGAVVQLAMAARRFQRGRVQSYLLYLLIGLAALAGLVLVGGRK
jgi:hydrogenase-4 component B